MKADYRRLSRSAALTLAICGLLLCSCSTQSGGAEGWQGLNAEVIKKHNLKGRERAIPETDVPLALEPGKNYTKDELLRINIAEGVTASLAWGKGMMVERVEMSKDAVYPEQQLQEELITVVQEGSATCKIGDRTLELGKDAVLYLTEGMTRSLKAGPQGWKAIEVYSPVRIDHVRAAGVSVPENAKVSFADQGITPSLEPGMVYNLGEIPIVPLADPDPSVSYKRASGNARLIWGKNAELSLVRMDPNTVSAMHIHPESSLMTTLRGVVGQIVMDTEYRMTGARGDTVLEPGNMAHGGNLGDSAADALDLFWPVRPDHVERALKQKSLYEEVISPGTKPVKLADGFTFTEGPTWLRGALYFSDMYFKDPGAGDWTGSPSRSRLIRMEPDGKWREVSKGMQTNGTIAIANGNLLVGDMFGHRVIEVDPSNGTVVRIVLSSINGKPIDGPNDLVMDVRGGVYVTDPQFTPEENKSQPGKQVYYIAPDGTAKVVIPAGEYAMPNGVEVSPDGKTLYVNNTWLQPGENFVYAYDIRADGSLDNKRKFAMVHVTDDVVYAEDPADRFDSRADGMAVDTDGRIYIATLMGVQVFDKTGVYVGNIWCPQHPVSCTFGGPNNDVLYMVGEGEVWSIQTKVKGFRMPQEFH